MNQEGLSTENTEPVAEEPTPESQEGLKVSYKVHIDREKLLQQEGIPEGMKEWLVRLPEDLVFKDAITLIVGENGRGKSTFARAVTHARGRDLATRNPDAKSDWLNLDEEEPAFAVSHALTTSETREDTPARGVYIDGAEVMSEMRRWAKDQAAHKSSTEFSRAEDITGGSYTHRLSSRQLFDQAIKDIKDQSIKFGRKFIKHVDIIFDEPEQGLSPQRQLDLPGSFSGFLEDGDTLLIPTNNLALYLSDLSRLDLSQPERGVYRPSDFGEQGKIVLHGQKD